MCVFVDVSNEQDSMEQRLQAAAEGKGIRHIVVSDGEQILGLGDHCVGGILIFVAKLILATAWLAPVLSEHCPWSWIEAIGLGCGHVLRGECCNCHECDQTGQGPGAVPRAKFSK